MDKPATSSDELLTKMECCELFCRQLKISKNTFYRYYRDHIKFRPTAFDRDVNGSIKGRLPRIPRRIALGLIHLLGNSHRIDEDPPVSELREFINGNPNNITKSGR